MNTNPTSANYNQEQKAIDVIVRAVGDYGSLDVWQAVQSVEGDYAVLESVEGYGHIRISRQKNSVTLTKAGRQHYATFSR